MRGCGHPASDLDKPCPWCRIAELERKLEALPAHRAGYEKGRADERERADVKLGRALREHLRDGCSDEFRDGFAAAIRALGDE